MSCTLSKYQYFWVEYKNLSLVWGVDRKIRLEGYCLASRGLPMSDYDPKGQIFLSIPHTLDRFFSLHTFHFQKWAFDSKLYCRCLLHYDDNTVTFSDVITFSDINLNDGVPWHAIQSVYIKHVKFLDFYLSHGTDKGVKDFLAPV